MVSTKNNKPVNRQLTAVCILLKQFQTIIKYLSDDEILTLLKTSQECIPEDFVHVSTAVELTDTFS